MNLATSSSAADVPGRLARQRLGKIVVTEAENAQLARPAKDGHAQSPSDQAADDRQQPGRKFAKIFGPLRRPSEKR
jgi:hypothetical protein